MKNSMLLNVVVLSVAALFFAACQSGVYPPSNYIGIFDQYNGYENGKLPGKEKSYSGAWRHTLLSGETIEGQYENGIPTGVWQSALENGVVTKKVVYRKNGTYDSFSYYPDGEPQSVEMGTYAFRDGAYKRKTEAYTVATGSGTNQSDKPWTSRLRGAPIFKNDGLEMVCDFELPLYEDNTFTCLVFVYRKHKGAGEGGKMEATGRFDPETGKIFEFSQKAFYGNYRLGIQRLGDGRDSLVLVFGDDTPQRLFILPGPGLK